MRPERQGDAVVCARLHKEFADLSAATGRDGGIVSVKAEVYRTAIVADANRIGDDDISARIIEHLHLRRTTRCSPARYSI
jgi:hypothetical protein